MGKNKNKGIMLDFGVIYKNNDSGEILKKITVPVSVVTGPIINYGVQHYNWDKDNVEVKFTEKGEIEFIINGFGNILNK